MARRVVWAAVGAPRQHREATSHPSSRIAAEHTTINHEGTVRIGGRIITNLRFADDIDGLASKEEELENLFKTVETASTAYGMEISPEKTNIMSKKANGLTKTIEVKGCNLETVTNFKYLGAIVTDQGTKREVLTRIAQATSAQYGRTEKSPPNTGSKYFVQ